MVSQRQSEKAGVTGATYRLQKHEASYRRVILRFMSHIFALRA